MFVLCFQILGEAERLNWIDFDVAQYLPPTSTIVQKYVFSRSHCNGRKMEAGDFMVNAGFYSYCSILEKNFTIRLGRFAVIWPCLCTMASILLPGFFWIL